MLKQMITNIVDMTATATTATTTATTTQPSQTTTATTTATTNTANLPHHTPYFRPMKIERQLSTMRLMNWPSLREKIYWNSSARTSIQKKSLERGLIAMYANTSQNSLSR